MRAAAKPRTQREPTIALINIVFLMLVFFLVAGTLSPPLDPTLQLVETRALEGRSPPDALVVHADGRLAYRDIIQPTAAAYVAGLDQEERQVVRLVPDRSLPAIALVTLTRELRAAGADKVVLVTKRGLE